MKSLLAVIGLAGCASYGHVEQDVVFTHASPLARGDEIARRTLPPVTYRRVGQTLAAKKLALVDQAIDLAKEKFDIFVPADAPPAAGYGLVVFVAPWDDPTRPRTWSGPLDRHGLIFVSAQRSGNTQDVLDRRVPLALLAYDNVRARYRIDPERVYIAGFSGGSRVAEIVALAYPDVFRGVLLNAGADPIDGRDGIYKPPAELFRTFQHSRVVFVTGDRDIDTLYQDGATERDLANACVLDVDVEPAARLAHQTLDRVSFEGALDALDAPGKRPRAIDAAELAACNARVARELAAALAEVEGKLARGDRKGARDQINAIDARYGGLGAPATLDLDQKAGD